MKHAGISDKMMMSVREVSGGSNFCVNCMECSTFTVSFLCYGSVAKCDLRGKHYLLCKTYMDLLIFLASLIMVISLYEY
jgi:hypothetical protein